jgi:hypothetical protein
VQPAATSAAADPAAAATAEPPAPREFMPGEARLDSAAPPRLSPSCVIC